MGGWEFDGGCTRRFSDRALNRAGSGAAHQFQLHPVVMVRIHILQISGSQTGLQMI